MLKSLDMQSMSSCFVSAFMKSLLFLDLPSVYLMLHLSVSAGWIRACVSLPLCYVSEGPGSSGASGSIKWSENITRSCWTDIRGVSGGVQQQQQQRRVRPSCNAFQELHKQTARANFSPQLLERRRHKHNLSRSRSENMRAAACLVASRYPETRLLIVMIYLRLGTIQ